MGAFHAYDIRGIYNKDFDKETVYKVGYFLPQLLGVNNIAVGRDARTSSPEIHSALLQGITDAGADVTDIGLATTPMVYFATAKYGFGCSVQITASHNPREYNGLKVSRKEALPVGLDSGLGEIERWIAQGKETPKSATPGKVICKDIKAEYLQFQSRYKGDYSNLNIGIDLSNGMAALIVKDLIPEGENVAYIYDTIDGSFPNHDPNPLVAENVEALKALVAERGCDIGVIYDGDADRVMFVDEKSRFIAPDLIIALMGHYWLEKRGLKGKVLQDIRSSKSVGEYLVPMGAQMATWRVGRAFAAPKLREIDGVYGGEFAGHYYFKEFFYSDSGIMASLIVLSILSDLKREGKTLSQVIDKIAAYNNSGEINFKIERKAEAMEAVKNWFTSVEKPTAIMDFDGYRVEFPDWWFNIRPSNTEPYLRLIAEAKGEKMLQEKVAKAREIIESFK